MDNNSLLGKQEKKLDELLGIKFLDRNEVKEINVLQTYPIVALYFGASWCPLSIKFSHKLIEFYNEINLEDKVLEIILVARDKNKDDFEKYYNDMPWLSLPYKDGRLKKLIEAHQIKGIPVLGILNKQGEMVYSEGRRDVCTYDDTEYIQNKWESLLQTIT